MNNYIQENTVIISKLSTNSQIQNQCLTENPKYNSFRCENFLKLEDSKHIIIKEIKKK